MCRTERNGKDTFSSLMCLCSPQRSSLPNMGSQNQGNLLLFVLAMSSRNSLQLHSAHTALHWVPSSWWYPFGHWTLLAQLCLNVPNYYNWYCTSFFGVKQWSICAEKQRRWRTGHRLAYQALFKFQCAQPAASFLLIHLPKYLLVWYCWISNSWSY